MSGLVSADWLEEHLDDPDVVVLEVSFYPPAGAAWFRGHIPGSRYVYWKELCWDPIRREMPDSTSMGERLGALGVGDRTKLVLVGDPIQFATYAYWVLAMTGFEHLVSILDGGHAAWEEERRALVEDPAPTTVMPAPVPTGPVTDARIGRDGVLAGLDDGRRALLDLRSAEEYRGERVAPLTAPFDHGAERGGHIPGAVHLPHERLLRSDGTFRDAGEISDVLEGSDVGPDREVVTYCRLSHRASLAWFALTRIADRSNVRVYDGSWTEWGSMVGMPIERSAEVSDRNG